MHGSEAVSPWVARWAHLVTPGSAVLDVACGMGRHAVYFSERGHSVAAVDQSQAAMDVVAQRLPAGAQLRVADIENGPWPFMQDGLPQPFGAVVVTNYLWRALLPTLVASLAPGGVLVYETFAVGNETVGKPSRADFLLRPGELLAACAGLRVVAFEEGFISGPERFVQRIVAVRAQGSALNHENSEKSASIPPVRYPL
jgi:SAM-dependent methyltransferase